MKTFLDAVLSLFFGLFLICFAFAAKPKAQISSLETGRKAVVVELFTSEGCSSCPPADALLQRLQEQQPVSGAEVIALEEHVDYWNHDGWSDPFSSPEWTRRQLEYGTKFKNDAYTPQMVVDGRTQFVGSSGRGAELEIANAARAEKTSVAITSAKVDATRSQRFTVSVGKLTGNADGDPAEVWLAVAEDGLHSSVSAGENAGRVLRHISTLRSLRKIGVAGAGPVSFTGNPVIEFKSHWDPAKLRVLVFVQKKKSREILGAASTSIKGSARNLTISAADASAPTSAFPSARLEPALGEPSACSVYTCVR